MTKIPVMTKFDRIKFLIDEKYPSVTATSKAPPPLGTKVTVNPDFTRLKLESNKYSASLALMTEKEIEVMYEDALIQKRERDEKTFFFNLPAANADFEYWSKMAHWKIDEAIALSFGKNPERVNKESIKGYQYRHSPLVQKYQKIEELARRAITWKRLFDPVLPPLFIRWAKENDIHFPEELEKKILSRQNNYVDWKQLYDEFSQKNTAYIEKVNHLIALKDKRIGELENLNQTKKPLHSKEKETLLKMIIGMATDGYGFDPAANRSPVPKEISDILAEKDMPLDVDTVRRWLKEAAEILPRNIDKD